MKKNIYELLNEVKVDIAEYDVEKLSSEETIRIQTRLFKEMNCMKKKNGKRAYGIKVAAAVCAMVILAGGVTAVAKGMFNQEIEQLIEIAQNDKDGSEQVALYEKVGENMAQAEKITAEEDKLTVEDQGITLSVTDSVCDGYSLYFLIRLSGDEKLLNNSDFIKASHEWMDTLSDEELKELDMIEYLHTKINGVPTVAQLDSYRLVENGDYVMMGRVDLLSMVEQGELELKDMEQLKVEYSVRQLVGSDQDKHEFHTEEELDEEGNIVEMEMGEYVTTMNVLGDWNLKFTVPVDKSQNKEFVINKEENGILLKKGIKTPLGLVLEVELPDMTKEPYNDVHNDPDIGICNGNEFAQWIAGYGEIHEDNSHTVLIEVLYDGETEMSLQVANKNVDGSIIADIPFEVPME